MENCREVKRIGEKFECNLVHKIRFGIGKIKMTP